MKGKKEVGAAYLYLGWVELLAGRVVGGEQALEDAVDAVVALHVRHVVAKSGMINGGKRRRTRLCLSVRHRAHVRTSATQVRL